MRAADAAGGASAVRLRPDAAAGRERWRDRAPRYARAAPTVSAIDLAHATEEQLFYIGELTEALPALLEADRALTEIFVCGRLYLEGDYGRR